jgi:5-hydroxyisourate hydrolase
MTTLSTHVLDAVLGRPAEGMTVRAFHGGSQVDHGVTDADGRLRFAVPLVPGEHSLVFATGPWFAERRRETFYPEVTVAFSVTEEEHLHVPILLSPFAYSTYRGS